MTTHKLRSVEITPNPYTISDKLQITGFGFPSTKRDSVTLGASLTTYKAPADGWFVAYCYNASYASFVNLFTSGIGEWARGNAVAGAAACVWAPCKKDTYITLEYVNCTSFSFIYSSGSQS